MIVRGPYIIRDELTLYLDAANKKSYPRTGDVWKDLSGNRNDANLIDSPVFNTGDGGYFYFSGVDDKAEVPTHVIPPTGPFSVTIIYQLPGNSTLRGGIFERKTTSPYNGISLGQSGSANWGFTVSSDIDAGNRLGLSWDFPTANIWYMDVGTFNGTNSISIYRNGSFVDSVTGFTQGNLDTQGTRQDFSIASRSTVELECKIAYIMVHQKELLQPEVTQNFNAVRGRFGL